MCGSAPAAPPAPDYTGAANATAAGNLTNSRYATQANRPNEVTPLGTRTWQQGGSVDQPRYDAAMATYNARMAENPSFGGPAPSQNDYMTGNQDEWTSTIALSPEQQALYDSSNRVSQNLANTAETGLGRVAGAQSQPFSTAGLPNRVTSIGNNFNNINPGEVNRQDIQMSLGYDGPDSFSADRLRVEDALNSRLAPQQVRDQDALRTRLSNQGLTQGSAAWGNEIDAQNRAQNDARMGVLLAGGNEQSRLFGLNQAAGNFANSAQAQDFSQQMGQQAQAYGQQMGAANARVAEALSNAGLANQGRGAGMDEQAYLRSLPLNELNALRTGSQVNMPQFGAYGQQQAVPGANVMGATQAQGQYDQGIFNAGVAQNNANTSGLYGLGAAGLTAAATFF